MHVELRVGDERLQSAAMAGEVDLVLDDGRAVRVAFDDRTRASGLRETRTRGRWERLSQEPEARLVSDRAPGPHVAASLVRTVLEPGARIQVRGAVEEWAAPAGEATGYRDPEDARTPARIVAAEITDTARVEAAVPGERARFALRAAHFGRALVVLLLVVTLGAYLRWTMLWPRELSHPALPFLRASAACACSLHLAVWLSLLLRRRGSYARFLPRFVRAGKPLSSEGKDGTLLFGIAIATLLGLGTYLVLERILATGDVLVAGKRGRPILEGVWIPGMFQGLGIVVGAVAAWLRERQEAKLAAMFRPAGTDWIVRTGRLAAGELTLSSITYGSGKSSSTHWKASASTLQVRSGTDLFTVDPAGLVWGIDTVDRADVGRTTTWTMGPGASIALAGRIANTSTLRASGPESLLLVAVPEGEDPIASLQRGLEVRRAVLGAALVLAILGAVIAYV